MNILIAPDKFKGSLTAAAAVKAIATGLRRKYPKAELKFHPLADGGDGTLSILADHLQLTLVPVTTVDPFGGSMNSHYLLGERAAFVEVASAAGLVLIDPRERDPSITSTYGTGLMVADALRRDVDVVYLLLGGSATNDVGTGIAQALGIQLLDKNGKNVEPIGAALAQVRTFRFPDKPVWAGKELVLLCDVTNPLVGQNGAAHVYAAQKGANPDMIDRLEAAALHFGKLLEKHSGLDVLDFPGGGAAGGIAAGLYALCGAKIQSGFSTISELTKLDDAIEWADCVITGEGQFDEQSLQGKVVGGILKKCERLLKPCHIMTGRNKLAGQSFSGYCPASVSEIVSLQPNSELAMAGADAYLTELAARITV